jgi:hypothetical protein
VFFVTQRRTPILSRPGIKNIWQRGKPGTRLGTLLNGRIGFDFRPLPSAYNKPNQASNHQQRACQYEPMRQLLFHAGCHFLTNSTRFMS